MKVFNLGNLPWKETQLIYHALAYNNIESLVLHSPKESYVSVSLHQNPEDEIDIKFCNDNNIGIFRREIGGGTVLLDNNQLFYNLILHRDNPIVPFAPESFFRKFLQPVIETYHEMGISVKYQPLCDLVVDGKKISGNGGGEIGECKVLGGSILFQFNYELMAQVVSLSDTLKDKFFTIMQSNLTTVSNELELPPSKDEVSTIMVSKYEDLLGPMQEGKMDKKINEKMRELDKKYSSEKWMYQRGTKQVWREVKVREGVYLINKTFNLHNGNVEITLEIYNNRISKILFSHDFPMNYSNRQLIEKKILDKEYTVEMLKSIEKLISTYGGEFNG